MRNKNLNNPRIVDTETWLPIVSDLSKRMKKAVIKVIRIYQLVLSPTLGSNCRFQPTCSQYAIDAVNEHGVFKGVFLSMKRLAKCHPFHPGGFDPVNKCVKTECSKTH